MSTSEKTPSQPAPRFYVAGVDIGLKHDYSAIAVVEKRDQEFDLVFLKKFPLGTEFGSVIGFLKLLRANLHDLRRIMIDQTGMGEAFLENAIKSGLTIAQGINLSQPKKQDVMTYLKDCMQDGRVHIPYDKEFINELNVERFELQQSGHLKFTHPSGTHDDQLWAFALAIYYARLEVLEYHPVAAHGKRRPGDLTPNFPRDMFKR